MDRVKVEIIIKELIILITPRSSGETIPINFIKMML